MLCGMKPYANNAAKCNFMIRDFRVRPRLSISILVGVLLWFALGGVQVVATRALVSWDLAVSLYLVLVCIMMEQSDMAVIRCRAGEEDEGKFTVLCLTIFGAIASLAAIVMELSQAKQLEGLAKGGHIALAGVTVLLSWTFMHTMFALHYAHEYYGEDDNDISRGLDFPGNKAHPDYWDFMYFSLVIGTAAATADIDIISPSLRKLAAAHCVLAFFFNTTILALTINIGASLLSG